MTLFNRIQKEIEQAIQANPRLVGLVRRFTSYRDSGNVATVEVERKNTADLPELKVIPTTGKINLHATSTSIAILRRYDVLIASGNPFTDLENNIEFEVLRSLLVAQTRLSASTIGIRKIDIVALNQALTSEENANGTRQWLGLFGLECEIWITKASLA